MFVTFYSLQSDIKEGEHINLRLSFFSLFRQIRHNTATNKYNITCEKIQLPKISNQKFQKTVRKIELINGGVYIFDA